MSSYSQRFLGHQRYISNAAEDILAVTVCIPFTMALYCWNSFADYLTELNFIPDTTDTKVWNLGRYILTLPLYVLKGLVALTVAPVLASILSSLGKEPKHYNFTWGRLFQVLALNRLVRFFAFVFLPVVLNNWLVWVGLLGMIAGTFFSAQLSTIGIMLWNIDDALSILVTTLPYLTLASQFVMAMSVPAIVVMSASMLMVALEGYLEKVSKFTANLIDNGIYFIQIELLKRGKPTFNNQEDRVSLDAVTDIPIENLFVSSSNYAFDLETIQHGVNANGLINYNTDMADGVHPRFDEDDLLRLEKHPNLQTKFPQLAQYVREHKHEYARSYNGNISATSIQHIRSLARAMLISQEAEPVRFAEQFVAAKEAFESHMNAISFEERSAIENLNLLGGTDPQYTFKNVFERACMPKDQPGSWCKKGASRLQSETCDRIEAQGTENNFVAFWQRPQPTHWMGMHARMG